MKAFSLLSGIYPDSQVKTYTVTFIDNEKPVLDGSNYRLEKIQ